MKSHINTTFLFGLIILVGVGMYLILKPFVVAILIAFVLSQLFGGVYKKLTRAFGKRKSLASLTSCLLIILIIFIPLVIISSLIVSETNQLFKTIQENNIRERIESVSLSVPYLDLEFSNSDIQSIFGTEEFSKGLRSTSTFFLNAAKKTYQNTSSFLFLTFVMFFCLYYFFKDGDKLLRKLMDVSPLKNSQERMIIRKFVSVSRATLKGTLVIAIVQGVMMSILFWITGVKSAVLWGFITALVSLIPLIGPVLVWAPVGIVMLLLGFVWQGVVILLVGGLVISTIDNFLRPKLVGDETSLHPLLVFLSTLGGLALFGIAGFLLGPVVVVLFITLLDIYQTEFKTDLKRFNK